LNRVGPSHRVGNPFKTAQPASGWTRKTPASMLQSLIRGSASVAGGQRAARRGKHTDPYPKLRTADAELIRELLVNQLRDILHVETRNQFSAILTLVSLLSPKLVNRSISGRKLDLISRTPRTAYRY
jgi:hypothetical protein